MQLKPGGAGFHGTKPKPTQGNDKMTSYNQPIQLQNPWWPGMTYRATSDQLKHFFGLRQTEKWPADGMTKRTVKGITLYVRPLDRNTGRREGMHSRLMAVCPDCSKVFSYGRLGQHMVSHQGAI